MHLPDRIRIEYDGDVAHPGKATRILDLDSGETLTNVLSVTIGFDRTSLEAELKFYDQQATMEQCREVAIYRKYRYPELAMHTSASKPAS